MILLIRHWLHGKNEQGLFYFLNTHKVSHTQGYFFFSIFNHTRNLYMEDKKQKREEITIVNIYLKMLLIFNLHIYCKYMPCSIHIFFVTLSTKKFSFLVLFSWAFSMYFINPLVFLACVAVNPRDPSFSFKFCGNITCRFLLFSYSCTSWNSKHLKIVWCSVDGSSVLNKVFCAFIAAMLNIEK